MLAVRRWGLRPYAESLAEMRSLRAARRRGEIPDTLLLVEHPPVLTVGVRVGPGALPPGVPVVAVERGGHATYHGPGQLVGYPIVDLAPRGRDVRRFVGQVEELGVATALAFGVSDRSGPGQRGVWVGDRKIASVGVAIEEWVTLHGIALNVTDEPLAVFRQFAPCGLPGETMSSLCRESGRPVTVAEAAPVLERAWSEQFGDAGPNPSGPTVASALPA